MPTSKVNVNRCGTHYPIWLDGTTGAHPTRDTDAVAKIKACINVRELRGGCYYRFTVGVKLCPGISKFFVYYLQKILTCYAAYCAGKKRALCVLFLGFNGTRHLNLCSFRLLETF